jgi:hypothetical protein
MALIITEDPPPGTTGDSGGVIPSGDTNADPNTPVAGVHNDLGGQSKWYLVVITSTRYGDVQAWLPDTIQFNIKSSWGPIVGNIDNALANYLGVTSLPSGTTFNSKKLTAQEWRGSEPLDLLLPLSFFATENAKMEVVEPIKRLIKMALPRAIQAGKSSFNLQPPGPVPNIHIEPITIPKEIGGVTIPIIGGITTPPIDASIGAKYQDLINVYIGSFVTLKSVFISSISNIEFKGKLSTDGLPMEGKCVVLFRTLFAPTSNDMDDYLGSGFAPPSNRPFFGSTS